MIYHNRAPQPLPSQPAERDDRRAEVGAATRAERHAEYLDTMADVIMDSGAAGKLEAKSVMMKAAKFIRETASTIDTLTADRDRLKARVEEQNRELAVTTERLEAVAHSVRVGSDVSHERDFLAMEARRYASHYPEASDGRNTFIIFAEMIEARTARQALKGEHA